MISNYSLSVERRKFASPFPSISSLKMTAHDAYLRYCSETNVHSGVLLPTCLNWEANALGNFINRRSACVTRGSSSFLRCESLLFPALCIWRIHCATIEACSVRKLPHICIYGTLKITKLPLICFLGHSKSRKCLSFVF